MESLKNRLEGAKDMVKQIQNIKGCALDDLIRWDPEVKHMLIIRTNSNEAFRGFAGEKLRLFLSDKGYQQALEDQKKGNITICSHSKVDNGRIIPDRKDRSL